MKKFIILLFSLLASAKVEIGVGYKGGFKFIRFNSQLITNNIQDIEVRKLLNNPYSNHFIGTTLDLSLCLEIRDYATNFSKFSIINIGSTQGVFFGIGKKLNNWNLDLGLGLEFGIPLAVINVPLGIPNFSGLIKLDYFLSEDKKMFISYSPSLTIANIGLKIGSNMASKDPSKDPSKIFQNANDSMGLIHSISFGVIHIIQN